MPRWESMTNTGMMITCIGIPSPSAKRTVVKPETRDGIRLSAYAAGDETATAVAAPPSVSTTLTSAAWPKPLSLQARTQFAKWRLDGSDHGLEKISGVCLSDETTMK